MTMEPEAQESSRRHFALAVSGRSLMVTANGLRHHVLAYEGAGMRGDVLILPGITSPAATADFIARPLCDLGYRVFVPDLRGRGNTDRAPGGGYRLIDYSADVASLIPALGLTRPALLGHSLGARIAAAYAALHAGAGHGAVVMVDPPLSGPGRAPYPTSKESFLAQLHEARRGTTADEVARHYPNWPRRELDIRASVLATCDERAVLETHDGFETEDFFALWARLRPPAVLIRGARSPVVPPSAAAELAAANPSIPIVAVSDAGHMVPWDNYDEFLRCLMPLI
jgi:N-formylmaleamate deformylase